MMLELLGLVMVVLISAVQPGNAGNGDILVVKVTANYSRPSSFSLDPPSYRAASDLTLSCEVEATNDDKHDIEVGLFYEWRSTCSGNCFVRGGSTKIISTPYLHSYDAGVHTCVVYDTLGCTGNASITVNVVGAGIYVESGGQVLSNNSVITNINQVIPNFRCLSGSNTSNIGSLIGPLGNDITRSASDPFLVMRGASHDPGTLFVRSLRSLEPEESGIYTYQTPNEAGNIIDFNVGLYSTNKSSPPICSDFTSSLAHTLPFVLFCYSTGSPPTQVIWEKDGVEIDLQENYTFTQTLVDRSTSAYNNTLAINKTFEYLIGEYSFTIVNSIGRSETCTKDIEAMEVSGHESPAIVGLSQTINCTTSLQVVRMEWVLVSVGDAVEERDDGGQILTLTLKPKDAGLNGAKFTCRIITASGLVFDETITVQIKVLSHILTIDGSLNPFLAGETQTVTCNVCSDFFPSVKWINSQNDKMITVEGEVMIGAPVFDGDNCTSLSLTFNSLKTSQGGRYTCQSVVDIPFSEKKLTRDIIVKIPPPSVSIIRSPSLGALYTTDTLDMVCIMTSSSVDTPTITTTSLVDPNSTPLTTDGSRLRVYRESEEHVFNLTASYSSLRTSDAGRYVCSASVMSNASSLFILSSDTVNDSTTFSVDVNVSISISYTPPDQYPDYAPPNYRAASSVTLTCVASGTTGHVTYRWSSTCRSCFASSSSSHTITNSFLRSRDAGVHTCSVTDSLGNTGSDVTTMNIVGAGIYVSSSYTSYRVGSQPNNSYAEVDTGRSYYYSSYRSQIYCCSNSSYSTGSITLPNGVVVTSNYGSYIRITGHTGSSTYAGCIELSHYNYYNSYYTLSSYHTGIYTCNILDSNRINIPVSIGQYSESGFPTISVSNIRRVILNGSLALTCQTLSAPPTNLMWYKDGSPINYDRDLYRVSEKVTNLRSANYDNSLMFINDDAEDMIGRYNCRTSTGRSSLTVSIQGLQITTSSDLSHLIIGSSVSSIKCSSDLEINRVEWYQGTNRVTSSYGSYSYLRHSGIVTTDDEGLQYRCLTISPYVTQDKNITFSVIVPDDWASVAITNSTDTKALHGTEYTLLCTVTTVAGLRLPLSVEWVGPDGDVIEESDGNRTLSGVVTEGTVSTLSLTFNPVLSSDGGRYTCRTSVNVPWMDSQPPNISNTIDMPVTTQALFQLKMFPVAHCSNWDVSTARDVETSIKREVEKAVRERCECDFFSTTIYSGEFSCRSSNCKSSCSLGTQVTYRAIVNGTSDLLTAGQLMEHIEDWRESRGTLLYNLFRLELAQKSECQLSIDSFDEKEC